MVTTRRVSVPSMVADARRVSTPSNWWAAANALAPGGRGMAPSGTLHAQRRSRVVGRTPSRQMDPNGTDERVAIEDVRASSERQHQQQGPTLPVPAAVQPNGSSKRAHRPCGRPQMEQAVDDRQGPPEGSLDEWRSASKTQAGPCSRYLQQQPRGGCGQMSPSETEDRQTQRMAERPKSGAEGQQRAVRRWW